MTDAVFTLHRGTRPCSSACRMSAPRSRPTSSARYTERALGVEDTDWFLDRLYALRRATWAPA